MATELGDELAKVFISKSAEIAFDQIVRFLNGKKAKEDLNPEIVRTRLQFHAQRIREVKTLLSTDSHVSIERFYCPPRVRLGTDVFVPKSSRDFKADHVLIEGIAGQGKSILLRYLCSCSIVEHGKLAFFYELRRLDPIKPLINVLRESLEDLGIKLNAEELRNLAARRDIEIYLDGFDEVDQKVADKIDRDLAYIANTHPLIKVFISARPHVGLAQNSELTAFRIEKLNPSDANRLIDKISITESLAEELKNKLAAHKARAHDLLETPLLVTLLVAQYAETSQIPERLSDFYENIFQTLFDRHDRFKVPYVRKRRLRITTPTYKKIFQRFCYGSLFANQLGSEAAQGIAEWASRPVDRNISPDDFLQDVCEISALIQEDIGLWSFIHNSVQEYYAAASLLAMSDAHLESEAARLDKLSNKSSREQVFDFAREIDEYRFVKFIEIPNLKSQANPLISNDVPPKSELMLWLKMHTTDIRFDTNKVTGGCFFSIWLDVTVEKPLRCFAPTQQIPAVTAIIVSPDLRSEAINRLCAMPIIGERIEKQAREKLEIILSRWKSASEIVYKHEQASRADNDFLSGLLSS